MQVLNTLWFDAAWFVRHQLRREEGRRGVCARDLGGGRRRSRPDRVGAVVRAATRVLRSGDRPDRRCERRIDRSADEVRAAPRPWSSPWSCRSCWRSCSPSYRSVCSCVIGCSWSRRCAPGRAPPPSSRATTPCGPRCCGRLRCLDESAVSLAVARPGVRGEPVTVTHLRRLDPVPFAWLFPSGVSMHAQATDRQEFT